MSRAKIIYSVISVLCVIVLVFVLFLLLSTKSSLNPSPANGTPTDQVVLPQEGMNSPTDTASAKTYVTFTLNVQDFSYPEKSAETLERLLDLHEAYDLPLTIYFTTSMVDYYAQEQPDLFDRILTNPLVSLGYHIRPPFPFHPSTPHAPDLSTYSQTQLQELITSYETHGLNLETGMVTDETGGFSKLVSLGGDRPYAVGVPVETGLPFVLSVYADMGATFYAGHSGAMRLGDTIGSVFVRPEQAEIKAFSEVGSDASVLLQTAWLQAIENTPQADPLFLNIKMHDNDFFAEQSAWTSVYLSRQSRKVGPPYDLDQLSELLSVNDLNAQWKLYEDLLLTVAQHPTFKSINIEGTYNLLP